MKYNSSKVAFSWFMWQLTSSALVKLGGNYATACNPVNQAARAAANDVLQTPYVGSLKVPRKEELRATRMCHFTFVWMDLSIGC